MSQPVPILTPQKQKEIQALLQQKVVDLDAITERRGFVYNFFQLAQNKLVDLSKNIFGDYLYERKNKFSVENKLKILEYLKEKSLLLISNLQQNNKKGYYKYDLDFFKKKPATLQLMREMVLHGKSQVQAAQAGLQRLKASRDFVRVQFLNESAYEFDRQRYCSMFWGLLSGCLINSTIYKKGRSIRKAALAITLAHVFGQVSYYLNLDKYFDSVYAIFEEQAETFMKQEKKRQKDADSKVFIKNKIQ